MFQLEISREYVALHLNFEEKTSFYFFLDTILFGCIWEQKNKRKLNAPRLPFVRTEAKKSRVDTRTKSSRPKRRINII